MSTSVETAKERERRNTAFQRRITLLSAGGTFLDGFDLTVIAVALPLILEQWNCTPFETAAITASAIIGALIGAVSLGNLTDRYGRKAMYMIDLLTFVVFAALCAVAQDIWQLVIFRFLLGIGIGADYPISATLVAEFASNKTRGRLGTTLAAMWFVGALFAYVIGLVMLPLGDLAWRAMLLMGSVFAVVVFVLRAKMPESPRWLVAHGQPEKAREVLEKIGADPADYPAILASKPAPAKVSQLFAPGILRTTVFVCGFWTCYSTAYYGISMYTPTILAPFTNGNSVLTVIGSGIVALLGLVGALIGMGLVDRWGRRPLIITSFAGLSAALAILAAFSSPTLGVLVALFSMAVLFANAGGGILNFVYPTELYPTNIRATGHGLATSVSRIGSILGVLVFPALIAAWGRSAALLMFTGVAVLGLVICLLMAPETKGRQLEDLLATNR